ncbi:hypothetical protein [Mucilaginibacter sp.]|uniref:hypothetical protein n=1 Tax=Mucilaginibacter sp. TaxID=1882438 RepID=UPI0035623FCC
MTTNNENIWGDDSNNQSQGSGVNSFDTPDNGDITNRDFSEEGSGTTTEGNYSGGSDPENHPDETPEERESDNEGTGYSTQTEVNQQQQGADTSYSEQNDVTPPNPHEFPSVGVATKTDFVSRPHGRTTGRMLGHEPGTEGI